MTSGRISPISPDTAGDHDPREKEVSAVTVEEARAQGRLILVAEDEPLNQKVIIRQLAMLGYAAEIADNGSRALEMWRAGNYALVLTDVNMPEMDGYTLAETIRREEGGQKRIPILALTANAVRGEHIRARQAGMDDYLTKPILLDRLRVKMTRWMPGITELGPANDPRELGPALDVAKLESIVGDDVSILREFLLDYRASAQGRAAELHAALDAGDTARISAIAHKLKSSSRSVGALAVGDLCAKMEEAGSTGDGDTLKSLMPEFDSALARVMAEIVRYTEES